MSYQQGIINLLKEPETKKQMITQHNKNRRPNIEILESYICFQNIKTVPGNRSYASTTKCENKICIV